MKKILFVFLILLFFIQYSFIDVLSTSNAWSVDLVVAFVIAVLLKEDNYSGLLWAFAAGLLVDYFSSMNLATYVIIFIFLSIMIELYKTKFAQSQKKSIMVFIAMLFGMIFTDVALFIFMKAEIFFGRSIDNVMYEQVNIIYYFSVKVAMAIVGIGIYKIINKVYDLAGRNSLELKMDTK